jgi:hypothetical protein
LGALVAPGERWVPVQGHAAAESDERGAAPLPRLPATGTGHPSRPGSRPHRDHSTGPHVAPRTGIASPRPASPIASP